ncbi:MAG: ferritin [Candidatus Cloacimonetes bacterium]|nr:ferritin [Candidatus Cloacimonadota bacterium]
MISKRLQDAINAQINKELFSEYLYLSMAAYFESVNLPGFANFMKMQVLEERFHAMKFFEYLAERGGRVYLEQINKPEIEFSSIIEIFEKSYKHEQFISKSIYELMDIAIEEKDHATKSFLNWYVDEQVEEEATMDAILNKLKMIDGKGQGILMMDNELAQRAFTPPTNN